LADTGSSGSRAQAAGQGQGHLLVVDDIVENLTALEAPLGAAGYSVVKAGSGVEALRLVYAERFDAILMDVEMPGLDGWALCRLLKADARTAAIPVVFMTARQGGEEQVLRALAMGGADYVTKPVNPEILVRRVAVLVRAHRAEAEQRRLAEGRAQALAALGAAQARALEERKLSGLTTMARGLAHEINNPLAAALSELTYLANGMGTPADREEALASAQDCLQRVRAVVERMRRLGDGLESSAPAALAEVVRAAALPLLPLLAERGISLALDLEELPPRPRAGHLAAVVAELVTNAGRASPDGASVRVSVRSDGEVAELVVADQGRGMNAEAIRSAFDPFYTEKQDWGAVGLGLPMCHSVVTGLGGTIEIQSSPGRGTEVVIRLPPEVRAEAKPAAG
jgi:signal transduction histidine kinase